jgi:predicted regulator of Ras-like GTPase activity (Roadblock/LC7/MglB family)
MQNSKTEVSTLLRCGLILTPAQDQAIDKILSSLMEKIPAQYILLTDNSGQLITFFGKREQADPVALGALVASDLVASQEMSHIMGEYQNYQLILREGPEVNTWIIDAGMYLVLMFKVSSSVPLGWTRLVIRRAAELIAKTVETPAETIDDEKQPIFNQEEFTEQIDKSLDELWQF